MTSQNTLHCQLPWTNDNWKYVLTGMQIGSTLKYMCKFIQFFKKLINCCSGFVCILSINQAWLLQWGWYYANNCRNTYQLEKCRQCCLGDFHECTFADLLCNTCAVWAPFQIPWQVGIRFDIFLFAQRSIGFTWLVDRPGMCVCVCVCVCVYGFLSFIMLSPFLESEEVLGFIFLIGKDNKWGLLHVASILKQNENSPHTHPLFFLFSFFSLKKKTGKIWLFFNATKIFLIFFWEKDYQIFNITKLKGKNKKRKRKNPVPISSNLQWWWTVPI
jgi:hypothetical protein